MTEFHRLIVNLTVELFIIRAYCLVLHLRSEAVFAVVHLAGTVLALALDVIEVSPIIRIAVIAPAVFVVFPVAYSRGTFRQRIVRCTVMATVMILVSCASILLCALLFGPYTPTAPANGIDLLSAIQSVVMILALAFGSELPLTFIKLFDQRHDVVLAPSVIALLLWSYAISIISLAVVGQTGPAPEAPTSIMDATYYALVVILCLISVVLFRRDVVVSWQASKHTASVRQSKHVRTEIDAAIRRSAIARRLHHKLANGSETLIALTSKGNTDQASTYLDALRAQAQNVIHVIPTHNDTTTEDA